MNAERSEIRSIVWSEVFPVARLLKSFAQALESRSLFLALLAVVGIYAVGRSMDAVWTSTGGGVLASSVGEQRTEIHVYASPEIDFDGWLRSARRASVELAARAEQARGSDLDDGSREMLTWVDAQLRTGRERIANDQSLTAIQRADQLHKLARSADVLRYQLRGLDPRPFTAEEQGLAIETLIAGSAGTSADEPKRRLLTLLDRHRDIALDARTHAGGPFAAWLDYQTGCFAAAVQGVASGRVGFGADAYSPAPTLFGSIGSMASGMMWLVTQRPLFALCFGFASLVILGLLGTTICRVAAIRITRDESCDTRNALGFVWERFGGVLGGPLLPVGVFLLAFGVMWLGGFVGGLIPQAGPIFTGLFGFLYLLGGVALAFCMLAFVFGFPLFWPTIAVEGSESFDAFQRASYVLQRPGSYAIYSMIALALGGLAFLLVRLGVMLVLKLTHAAVGSGMSICGVWSSSRTETVAPLDALWAMPPWRELSILPTVSGTPFWGTFGNAPTAGIEGAGGFLLAIWVFVAVGIVGAFVISFYFTACTNIYLLLRQNVDGVGFDEILFEEELDDLDVEAEQPTVKPAAGKGVALPVVGDSPR
ncbi:MAG: hypothetical protein ACKVS9_15260 [Phycisphaerae bacterium]